MTTAAVAATLRAELEQLVERYREAEAALRAAENNPDRAAAEWAKIEATGELDGRGKDMADLFLLLLRQAVRHRPDALGRYLLSLLAPDVGGLVRGILRERHQR